MKKKSVSQSAFFKFRVLLGVMLCFAGITVVLFALGQAVCSATSDSVAVANKIAPWVMEHTANGQQAEFFVVLADQADLSGAANLQTKNEKARFVYDTLLSKSQATQERILQWLRDRAIEHRSYYIVNAILVKGNRDIAETLAARPDVARVEGNPLIHNDLPQPGPVEQSPPHVPATIEPGISYTHAPQVWALGFTGQNIVIASADTGVRWTHNALKPHYRGWDGVNANHNYNWHDSIHDSVSNPCGNDSPFPCDDFFHGSHTTGTAIGDDGMGNQIGMAPGAKWIGCRNMDQGNGTPDRYMECMEFFLAPYPLNCTPAQGDPTKAPDITINSWSCPTSEGCSADTLQAAVESQAAAGIMMVAAAQNAGPNCSTVTDPPGIYAAAYSAGALTTGTDTIAGFSSRGPVTVDQSNRIKPDISAPGTGTRSCSNTADNAYTTASGTSMATPHISGAMGLLWCALPSFRHQITTSRDALNNAAVHIASSLCGDPGPPNNVYGWGRVDIAAAVGVPSPTPSPSPTATATGTPVACAAGTATPTPTPTATAAGCSWAAGPDMPSPLVRAVGVYFPDGNFYTMGGRTADTAGSDFQHVLQYNPGTNAWTQKGVTLPDNTMNNMACGVLTVSGTSYIYCVGGSAAGQTTATARVFFYNPISDTVTTLTGADNWPGDAAGTILPGGFAVTGDKLYILGGFNINVASTNQIWQFDPTAAVGSKWLQRTNTPVGIMYAPTAAIGGIIYVGGASDYQGGTVVDTTTSFSFDPVANTIGSIAAIPRATGETRGLNFNGKLYVMGGGRVAPNPSTEVDVYNPGTNTWGTDLPFVTPRRNFPTDTNGTNRIWLSGGYASDGITPLASMEIFMCAQGSPTPTPTATATATHTPTATPTATAIATATPTATATATATHTPTATPTATATATHTPTATPTATPTPTSSARPIPTARPRPTPPPRP